MRAAVEASGYVLFLATLVPLVLSFLRVPRCGRFVLCAASVPVVLYLVVRLADLLSARWSMDAAVMLRLLVRRPWLYVGILLVALSCTFLIAAGGSDRWRHFLFSVGFLVLIIAVNAVFRILHPVAGVDFT